jgi:6,7-dimethyl-8-ribityllumazine synthase
MASAPNILIVEARFYDDIADALVDGATAALEAVGATYERIQVPGAFEIPATIGFAARGPNASGYDGFIGLGCVIRGQTTHYDYVCQESARGLQDLAIRDGLALGYGILTCENRDQALARARKEEQDRGGAAARACLAMIEIKRRFDPAAS